MLTFSAKEYAFLIVKWTGRDLRSRYKRSQLRMFWAVLQPFLFVLIYVVIFGVVFQQTSGEIPYLSYILSGVVVYRIVTSALNASSSLVDNHPIISQSKFPHEIIPISRILGNSADMAVTVGGLLIVGLIQGVKFSTTVLFIPVVVMSTVIFAIGLGIVLATVQVFIRDLEFVITFVSMALFFASPISYLPEQLPVWLAWLNWVNPVSVYIAALRAVTFEGVLPGALFWSHFLMSCGLLVASCAYVRAIGYRMIDLG